MIDLIFDTETTGFARFNDPYEHPDQPEIVQIAAKLVDSSRVHAAFQMIVTGNKSSTEGALKTHGITDEIRAHTGLLPQVAASMFTTLLGRADRLIAHNVKFDRILVGELFYRSGYSYERLDKIPEFCTMLALTPVMKLPGKRGGYKWPKLIEAYKAYIDPAGFEGAHDAMADVIACEKVFEVCKKLGLVPEESDM